MEAVKCIGSRTRGDGAEEVFDLGSNAKPQNGVMLIWCKNPSLIILFQGDEAPPKNPRAHSRRNIPLKGITYESHECKSSPSWHESGADIQGVNGSGMPSPPCIQLERPHAVLVAPSYVVGC